MDMPKEAVEATIHRKLRSTRIGAVHMDDVARKVLALSGLRSLRAQTVRELDVPGKGEANLPSWDDLREGWYDERLKRA